MTALVEGASITAAAEAADVARQTVSTWRNRDAVFIAALNQTRAEVNRARAARCAQIDAQALEVIADAIAEGDTRAALTWVKVRKLDTATVYVGPTTTEAVIMDKARELGRHLSLDPATDAAIPIAERLMLPNPDETETR